MAYQKVMAVRSALKRFGLSWFFCLCRFFGLGWGFRLDRASVSRVALGGAGVAWAQALKVLSLRES
jgi:hypothetical protein